MVTRYTWAKLQSAEKVNPLQEFVPYEAYQTLVSKLISVSELHQGIVDKQLDMYNELKKQKGSKYVDKLLKAVKFYANRDNWHHGIIIEDMEHHESTINELDLECLPDLETGITIECGGKMARETLKEIKDDIE